MRSIASRIKATMWVLGLAVLVAGCASGPSVIVNSAPDFSLNDYRSFGFVQPLSTDRGGARSLLSTHLINATAAELEAAGLSRVDRDPDLLVNFIVSTRETISSRPSSGVSMHHSRGRYSTWPAYSMSMSTTEIVQRTEGTVAVDIIDRQRNQLVWEGAASGRVTDRARENLEQSVNVAITEIFAQFP
jgi:hypothetical protein